MMLPSLYVLSRTVLDPAIRIGMALVGVVLSSGWLLDRTGLIVGSGMYTSPTEMIDGNYEVPAIIRR